MQSTDLHELAGINDLADLPDLHGRWVAIDPRGGNGLKALSSGAVLVDFDAELDELCMRVAAAGRSSLDIFLCHRRGAA